MGLARTSPLAKTELTWPGEFLFLRRKAPFPWRRCLEELNVNGKQDYHYCSDLHTFLENKRKYELTALPFKQELSKNGYVVPGGEGPTSAEQVPRGATKVTQNVPSGLLRTRTKTNVSLKRNSHERKKHRTRALFL